MFGKKDYWKQSMQVGLFFALLFVVCFVWYWIQPAQRELHQALLQLSFLGWSGMNTTSFVLGLIQSLVWGYIVVGLWHLACLVHKK